MDYSFLYRIWGMRVEIEVLSGEGGLTVHRWPESLRVTNTSKKGNLLSGSFSIVNCIDGRIEFTWSSNIWTSSWWGQRMNVSSTYLSHIDGFSDVDPYSVSSKYSMYMLANIGDNGEPIAPVLLLFGIYPYLPTSPLGQDMTQGLFLSGV